MTTALSTNQLDSVGVAIDAAKASYREHHRTVQGLIDVLDAVIASANDTAARLLAAQYRVTETQQHLNTVCHQRDDEAEENRELRAEVARLTAENEQLREGLVA